MHKGWHSRGYLPHFDEPNLIQGITFRLNDSLPAHVLEELNNDPKWHEGRQKRNQLEKWLNSGYGECHLNNSKIATELEQILFNKDGEHYHLIAWVIMPNHVHVLAQIIEGFPLHKTIQAWKSISAHYANLVLKRDGRFWYPDYFDRFIRNERHFERSIRYIHHNPVAAGLVESAEDWRFTSARLWKNKL